MPASPSSQWWETPYCLCLKNKWACLTPLEVEAQVISHSWRMKFSSSDTSTPLICGQTVNTRQDLQNSAAEEQLPPTPSAPLPPVWHSGVFPSQMGPQQDVLLLALSPVGDTGSRPPVEDQFYFHLLMHSFAEECCVKSLLSSRRFKSINTKNCDCGEGEQKLENKLCVSL